MLVVKITDEFFLLPIKYYNKYQNKKYKHSI